MTLDFRYFFIRIGQCLVYFSNYLQDNFLSCNDILLKGDEELLIIKLDRIGDAVWAVKFCIQLKNSYKDIKISVLCNSYNKFVFAEYSFLFSKIVEIDSNPRDYTFPNVLKLLLSLLESINIYFKNRKKLKRINSKKNYWINFSGRKGFFISFLMGNSVGGGLGLFNFLYKYPLLCHDEIGSETHIIQKWLNKFNINYVPENIIKSVSSKKILLFLGGKFPSKLEKIYYDEIKYSFVSLGYKVDFLADDNANLGIRLKKTKKGFEVNGKPFSDFLKKYSCFVAADGGVLHYASLYTRTVSFYSSTNYLVASPSVLNTKPIRKINDWSIFNSNCSNHIVVTKGFKCKGCFQFGCILKKCGKFIDNEIQMIIKLVVETLNN